MQNLLVAGGDSRMLHLAQRLEDEGWIVETLGLRPGDEAHVHMEQADAVLLPYPFSVRDGHVPVLMGEKPEIGQLLARLPAGITLLCGRGMEDVTKLASFCVMNYTDDAAFEQRNAALSAEAAVCQCMMHSRVALMDAKALVTGYGLFGRALACRLKALGTEVWVAARREVQRQEAEEDGMKAVSLLAMEEVLPQMDLVLNTIPARILGEYHLKQMNPKGCLLELASAPGGFDADTAGAMGLSCQVLPGLPARYSPESAAISLKKAVQELLGRDRI